MIENTAKRDPATHLLGSLRDRPAEYTEEMEAAGGRQLAASDLLPTRMSPADEKVWTELGFAFGDEVEADPLVRQATLPPGWRRQSMDDPRGSAILDERGIRRVGVFYKAAFYDRRADMHLTNVGHSLATEAIYGDGEPRVPWDVLTEPERADLIAELNEYVASADEYPAIYGDRLPRVRAILAAAPKAEATDV